MKKQFIETGYTITSDSTFQNKRYGVTPEIAKLLESVGVECFSSANEKLIDKVTQLIIKYPTIPLFKNYLSIVYNKLGNMKKAVEINKWILLEHPDYLFAKINAANICIDNDDYDEVPNILGENFDLKLLYPERDVFHIAEVTGFMSVTIRYFAAIRNIEVAKNRLEILKKIAPDSNDTVFAEKAIDFLEYSILKEKIEENAITPISTKIAPTNVYDKAPIFNHPEIDELYNWGTDIPHDILESILELPRKTLIADLETVIQDAINRYGYFSKLEHTADSHTFVIHAFYLLKELDSTKSLSKILDFLEYDIDFVEFWLDEYLNSSFWQVIFGLGCNKIDELGEFLLKPGVTGSSKLCVSEALTQIQIHFPENQDEITTIYRKLFAKFLNAKIEDNIIDNHYIGAVLYEMIKIQNEELLPEIKQLFDKKLVHLNVIDSYQYVIEEIKNNEVEEFEFYENIQDIYDIYDENNDEPDDYFYDEVMNDYDDDDESDSDYDKPFEQAVSDKINRNEPCPCGSGKKYKKCCLNK